VSFLQLSCDRSVARRARMVALRPIVLAFREVSGYLTGWAFTAAQMATIFSGDFGPAPGSPFMVWIATVSMTMPGPVSAWLTARFGSHHAGI
jgi:hypothetical protein